MNDVPKVTQSLGTELRFKTRSDPRGHGTLNGLGTTLSKPQGVPSHTPASHMPTHRPGPEALGEGADSLHPAFNATLHSPLAGFLQ